MDREDYNLLMEEYDAAEADRKGEIREILFSGMGHPPKM